MEMEIFVFVWVLELNLQLKVVSQSIFLPKLERSQILHLNPVLL